MTDETPESVCPNELKLAFWNVQNLFDLDSSPIAAELGFTAVHGWDRRAFKARIQRAADVIRSLCDNEVPDLLGVCEIENVRVAELLLEAIGRDDLKLAKTEQSPETGLDTALFYSADRLDLNAARSRDHQFHFQYPTRDAFEGHFTVRDVDRELIVMVTHWPTRRPSVADTDGLRWTAARYCSQQLERLLKLPRKEFLQLRDSAVSVSQVNDRWHRPVVLLGDFNDEPWDRNIQTGLHATYSLADTRPIVSESSVQLPSYRSYASSPIPLFNPMWRLLAQPDAGTTCRRDELRPMKLFDQILVSGGLLHGNNGMRLQSTEDGVPRVQIARPSSLMDDDGTPRAFELDSGNGVSDHFPVTATLQLLTD